jgi:hypothetical protein
MEFYFSKIFYRKETMKEELTLARLRQMGGQAVLKKYGKDHFSKLGKLSALKKKALSEAKSKIL